MVHVHRGQNNCPYCLAQGPPRPVNRGQRAMPMLRWEARGGEMADCHYLSGTPVQGVCSPDLRRICCVAVPRPAILNVTIGLQREAVQNARPGTGATGVF